MCANNKPADVLCVLARHWSWRFYERGQGILGWVESSTISFDPVSLLASRTTACCVCAHLFHSWQPGVIISHKGKN